MKDETSSAVHAETRRLAAIMFTDMVGFSRQMGSDETRMLRLLDVHNQVIQQAVDEHHGAVIKTVGDAFLVDFPSVVHAVQCAQQIQMQFRTHNAEKEAAEQIHVRIGIHLGDIIQREGDEFGDGVNIASRLQGLAEPDSICISDVVYRDVAKKLDLGTVVSFGKPKLKNIAERFQVYALLPEQPTGLRQQLQVQWLKASRRVRPTYRAAVAGLLLIAATVVAARYFSPPTPNPQSPTPNPQSLPLPDKPSIVVLPFVNMNKDPEQEYFSDGLTEVLTSDLSKLSALFVISRNTAFAFKGKAVKVQAVSKELGVQYVLEGSVLKSGEQVRITAQLIDATQDHHLWTERYDRPLKDIFALQDEIVQKIVTTLKLQLTLLEQGLLMRKTTDNLEAYDYYLRGWEYFGRLTKEWNAQARQMFEKAIELDPQYAEAYQSLGWTYLGEFINQWSQDPQILEQAFALAQKAIALDDSLPIAHMALGEVYLYRKQHEQAIAEAQRAIALEPNNADGHVILADILTFAGRPEQTITLIEKAMRLNPRAPLIYLFALSRAYRLTGRHEEAIATLIKSLGRNPNFLYTHFQLAGIYSELGREAEARAEAAEVLRLNPNFSLEVWRQRVPFKDPTIIEHWIEVARKAGLK
jgi:adenylate cyclase